MLVIIGIFVYALSSGVSYYVFSSTNTVSTENYRSPVTEGDKKNENGNGESQEVADNEPKTEECPINGKLYSATQKAKWEQRRPLGIMVENHTDARPQSGLSSADVVYEAVAEGGITRFLTIYYCNDAKYVGPVRSARMYFLRILQGYGQYPLYGHVGGANTPGPADALGEIKKIGWNQYNDLNQFSVPFPNFYRDYDRLPDRATEHTVYTSTQKLWKYANDKRKLSNVDEDGKSWDTTFKKWTFSDEAAAGDRGAVAKISFGFWDSFASDFAVDWNYKKETNSYVRDNGGKPHVDKNTNKPLEAKNIVIAFVKESPANDGYQGGHLVYKIVGTGEALVFQNGKAIEGTWSKTDEETQMVFLDKKGKEIPLVRGQVFVEILPTGNKVTY